MLWRGGFKAECVSGATELVMKLHLPYQQTHFMIVVGKSGIFNTNLEAPVEIKVFLKIILFVPGCAGSSLLCTGASPVGAGGFSLQGISCSRTQSTGSVAAERAKAKIWKDFKGRNFLCPLNLEYATLRACGCVHQARALRILNHS